MSPAGVAQLYFIMSKINLDIYHDILEHSMFPSTVKLYGDASSISSRTAHMPGVTKLLI